LRLATLKNDDVDDDENGDGEDGMEVTGKEDKFIRSGRKEKGSEREKKPTGRVVGVIKRNWRSYVFYL
jgi:exosome complex exonuclease DIS3/RRP44